MNATWLKPTRFICTSKALPIGGRIERVPVVWVSSIGFHLSADMRPVDRKQRLFGLAAVAAAFNHHSRSTHALARGLTVVWVSITDTNNPTTMLRLIDVGAVYRVNTKAHHVPGLSWNWDGIG